MLLSKRLSAYQIVIRFRPIASEDHVRGNFAKIDGFLSSAEFRSHQHNRFLLVAHKLRKQRSHTDDLVSPENSADLRDFIVPEVLIPCQRASFRSFTLNGKGITLRNDYNIRTVSTQILLNLVSQV